MCDTSMLLCSLRQLQRRDAYHPRVSVFAFKPQKRSQQPHLSTPARPLSVRLAAFPVHIWAHFASKPNKKRIGASISSGMSTICFVWPTCHSPTHPSLSLLLV